MSEVGQAKHQELIDELVEKITKYKQVKEQESSLRSDLLDLQNRLQGAGIDYKIPIEGLETVVVPTVVEETKKKGGRQRRAVAETKPVEETKEEEAKVPVELTYELVVEAADGIMKNGRAVSVSLLTQILNLEKSEEKSVREYLKQAQKEGRYESVQSTMYAFPIKFPIYFPRGKELPFLPGEVSTAEYDTLIEKSKEAIGAIKKKFTQQEFYKFLKTLGEKEGIGAKKIMMTIPSLLRNFASKGVLETNDLNTYRRVERADEPSKKQIPQKYEEPVQTPPQIRLDDIDQKILSSLLEYDRAVGKKELSKKSQISKHDLNGRFKKLADLGYVSSSDEGYSVTRMYIDEQLKASLGVGILPRVKDFLAEISDCGPTSLSDLPTEINSKALRYLTEKAKLLKLEGSSLKLTRLGEMYSNKV